MMITQNRKVTNTRRGLVPTLIATITVLTLMLSPRGAAQTPAPPADQAFSSPTAIGPGSRYFVEDPHIVREADNSLSAVWSWNLRDHVFYVHSTDNGSSWSDPVSVGGNPLWGGSEGNINLAADKQGQLHLVYYELYGAGYPHIEYRLRKADGAWQPPVWLPQSSDLRMKIDALTVDHTGRPFILEGHSGDSLYLYSASSEGTNFSAVGNLPLVPTSQPNPVWQPTMAVSDKGTLVVAWGDAREDGEYRLATAWYSNTWHTHIFDERDLSGNWQNGAEQYAVRMAALPGGGIAAVFEGRAPGQDTTDIYYREWNPDKYGLSSDGWETDTIHFPAAAGTSQSPSICVDKYGQRYVFWQADFSNLRIVYTYSFDGVNWTPLQLVNGGDYVREKHPSCAVAGDKLHVMWDDKLEGSQNQLYYASRSLPPLYPAPPPTATVTIAP